MRVEPSPAQHVSTGDYAPVHVYGNPCALNAVSVVVPDLHDTVLDVRFAGHLSFVSFTLPGILPAEGEVGRVKWGDVRMSCGIREITPLPKRTQSVPSECGPGHARGVKSGLVESDRNRFICRWL